MTELISKDEIIAALTLLGQRAAREGLAVELFVVGGTAFGGCQAPDTNWHQSLVNCLRSTSPAILSGLLIHTSVGGPLRIGILK